MEDRPPCRILKCERIASAKAGGGFRSVADQVVYFERHSILKPISIHSFYLFETARLSVLSIHGSNKLYIATAPPKIFDDGVAQRILLDRRVVLVALLVAVRGADESLIPGLVEVRLVDENQRLDGHDHLQPKGRLFTPQPQLNRLKSSVTRVLF